MNQLNHFAGNMLQVINQRGERLLVMSSQAYASLSPAQIRTLEKYARLVQSGLDTIETNGGGSARCMMAEVFLPLCIIRPSPQVKWLSAVERPLGRFPERRPSSR